MKLSRLLLPLTLLISLASCSTPEPTSTKIETREEVQRDMALILNQTSLKAQDDTFGLTFSSTKGQTVHLNADLAGQAYDISVAISPFTLELGANKLSGTKEEAKLGITSSTGLAISAKGSTPEGAQIKPFDYRVSTGKCGIYLMDGIVYADLSKSNIKDVVLDIFDEYIPSGSSISQYRSIVSSILGTLKYQYVIPGLEYPIFQVKDMTTVDYNEVLQTAFNTIQEAGLDWKEFFTMYSNSDGSYKIEAALTKEFMESTLEKSGLAVATFETFEFSLCLYTDTNKVINRIEVIDNIDAQVVEGGINAALKAQGDYAIDFMYGRNNIEYPSYDVVRNYMDLNAIIELIKQYLEPKE